MKHIDSIVGILKRAKRGLAIESDTALANLIGLDRSTVSNWKKGKGESAMLNLVRLADQHGWSMDWLLRGIGTKEAAQQAAYADEFAYVPLLSVEVSAGGGAFNADEGKAEAHLAFRRDWLRRVHLQPDHLCAVQVRGASMEPTLRRGDTILINLQDKDLSDGELFVVRTGVDGAVVVKRAALTDAGSWALRSDNRVIATDYLISGETVIVGRVVWVGVTL